MIRRGLGKPHRVGNRLAIPCHKRHIREELQPPGNLFLTAVIALHHRWGGRLSLIFSFFSCLLFIYTIHRKCRGACPWLRSAHSEYVFPSRARALEKSCPPFTGNVPTRYTKRAHALEKPILTPSRPLPEKQIEAGGIHRGTLKAEVPTKTRTHVQKKRSRSPRQVASYCFITVG